MKKNDSQKIYDIQYYYIIIGVISLFLGSLIYIIDRPTESTYFVKTFLHNIGNNLHGSVPYVFGNFSSSTGSFLHTFSFTLITGAFIGDSKKGCVISAVMWLGINMLFEIGQYFDNIAVNIIPYWFKNYIYLNTLDDYFIAGTFDFWDIAAVFAGAATGYATLVCKRKNIIKISDTSIKKQQAKEG